MPARKINASVRKNIPQEGEKLVDDLQKIGYRNEGRRSQASTSNVI
jgi:hypothetical protein